jgi:hypothetical protein
MSVEPVPLGTYVDEAAQRFGIPVAWIQAVMLAESFGDVRAISPKGAIGLMQIMPETWVELRMRYALGADPYDPHDNVIAGTAYLRELRDRYGSPGFLAAYNAGPALWEDHLATGRALPEETQLYLGRLAPIIDGGAGPNAVAVASVIRSWTEAPLFPGQSERPTGEGQPATASTSDDASTQSAGNRGAALAPQAGGLFVALLKPDPQP